MSGTKSCEKIREIQGVVAPLFAYRGYHSTSMREIARELGINQSTLYHYYRSKEDILFDLMNDAVEGALSTLKEILSGDLPPREKLIQILRFYTRFYAGAPERLILLVHEQHSLTREHRESLVEKQREYMTLFKEVLQDLKGKGLVKEIPDSVAIFAFLGMVHYTITWYHKDGPLGLDTLADLFAEIFTRGILT